jgi:hypothetical protein
MELESRANNLEEWLKELEAFEHKQPEDMYYVKVSARLMCKILRIARAKQPPEEGKA